jgi:hypothetical protein
MKRVAAVVFATGMVLLVGCKPKPGGSCKVGQVACEDPGSVLACQGGVFVEAHCRGPGGCAKVGSKVTCDDSLAEDGDACLQAESENRACSPDKKLSLLCEDGKFKTVQTCRGHNGCRITGEIVTCDSHIAQKDDPCPKPGQSACTADFKTRLVCKDGRMAFDRNCRGLTGCRESDFSCDESVSELGDPCGVAGMKACGTDQKNELVCQGGQYVVKRECKKLGCHVLANRSIDCE